MHKQEDIGNFRHVELRLGPPFVFYKTTFHKVFVHKYSTADEDTLCEDEWMKINGAGLTATTVSTPQSVCTVTGVFLEADGEWRFPDLLLEQIFLVEEQNDRGVGEPLVVADRVKQFQTFLHSILQPHRQIWSDQQDITSSLYSESSLCPMSCPVHRF